MSLEPKEPQMYGFLEPWIGKNIHLDKYNI